MPCYTKLKAKQTVAQRAAEVRKAGEKIDKMIASGKVGIKVDRRTGGVVFTGIPDDTRDGMTDVCIIKKIWASGSHAAKQALAKAERAAGRSVDKRAIEQGLHSHDGGKTWGTD
jgi:hypothetical protein